MKTRTNTLVLSMLAIALLAACSSELKDAADLPGEPAIIGVHGVGYKLSGSENFHGTDISQNLGWDISSCRSCHNVDYSGGNTGQSCNGSGCHIAADGGPEACYTCHGNRATKKVYPQWYASHAKHLEGGLTSSTTIPCSNCHDLPANYSDPIHVDKTTPGKAEVLFSNTLAATQTLGTTGAPAFNAADASCANVYCHGNFTNGTHKTVAWKGADQAKCGSCHGDEATGNPWPGGTHDESQDCVRCHAGIVNANREIIDPSRHVNGILNVFNTERTDW
jgi:predicted CxxxxCH...CXXCH cytochrome family protein